MHADITNNVVVTLGLIIQFMSDDSGEQVYPNALRECDHRFKKTGLKDQTTAKSKIRNICCLKKNLYGKLRDY